MNITKLLSLSLLFNDQASATALAIKFTVDEFLLYHNLQPTSSIQSCSLDMSYSLTLTIFIFSHSKGVSTHAQKSSTVLKLAISIWQSSQVRLFSILKNQSVHVFCRGCLISISGLTSVCSFASSSPLGCFLSF